MVYIHKSLHVYEQLEGNTDSSKSSNRRVTDYVVYPDTCSTSIPHSPCDIDTDKIVLVLGPVQSFSLHSHAHFEEVLEANSYNFALSPLASTKAFRKPP